jgi:rare lipoprotein A
MPLRADRLLALLLPALLLAACAGSPKRVASVPPASQPDPSVSGPVKIGKPYTVFGKTYVPADDRTYDETGIASWYGPGFNALSTANGERYNQDDITAAHKTLPMPSWVEVTNLDNGRQLTVRINDRGPFVDGRIIDLSRRSAQLLGVDRVGLARVRVRRVFPAVGSRPMLAAAEPAPPAIRDEPVRTVALPGAAPPPPPRRCHAHGDRLHPGRSPCRSRPHRLDAWLSWRIRPGGAGASARRADPHAPWSLRRCRRRCLHAGATPRRRLSRKPYRQTLNPQPESHLCKGPFSPSPCCFSPPPPALRS